MIGTTKEGEQKMLWKTIKKDLKRKKTMNIILLLFVILATVFVASGINNVVTVMNGTDYYFQKAQLGDYMVITSRENAIGALDEILNESTAIDSYRLEDVIYASEENFSVNGREVKTRNAGILQGFRKEGMKFFDQNNEQILEVQEGHVLISGSFMKKNQVQAGDRLRICHGNVDLTVIVDGKIKDAFLGSDMMGNTRFLLNEKDMEQFFNDEGLKSHYGGQICYIDTKQPDKVSEALADVSNVAFSNSVDIVKMCYVMDMIVAFLILVMSVCLMIVAFMVLKFTISFTIMEEYREIGVMKAIGISNFRIRSLYIGKYLLMAVVGAAIGFGLSIPFGELLMKSASENMVLGNEGGYWMNIIGALLVVAIITWFAYACTKKVKKATPIDAIRNGQTGERYRKKTIYRMAKSHLGTGGYLALNDILSSPRRFCSIIVSFVICTVLVLLIVNTADTMKSPNLINLFLSESDAYVVDTKTVMDFMGASSKDEIWENIHQWEERLEENGIPNKITFEFQYKYKFSFEGKDYNITCQQGWNNQASDYVYLEGSAPQNEREIAISPAIAKLTGAHIGDTLVMDYGEQKINCLVTATFQSMNQLGEVVRLSEKAPTDQAHCVSGFAYQINYLDEPTEDVRKQRLETIKEVFDTESVYDAAGYCELSVEAVGVMDMVSRLLLGITLVVVMLITVLMERSFIADEKTQIAMLKAVGFNNHAIIRWQVYRFGIIALIAEMIAAVLSIPATKLVSTPIFGMMGAQSIQFHYDPLKIFIIYPVIVVTATLIMAWLTALHTKKISSSDTANIE